jgi:hypothetical protein
MIRKSQLDAAKAFLCWEEFPDLSIQLVALGAATGYYFPPDTGLHSILLFYNSELLDFSEPLFLLFHEAGHVCQWRRMQANGEPGLFSKLMALDRGPEKAAFEAEAWRLGGEIFARFADKQGFGQKQFDRFLRYGDRCAGSYDHEER